MREYQAHTEARAVRKKQEAEARLARTHEVERREERLRKDFQDGVRARRRQEADNRARTNEAAEQRGRGHSPHRDFQGFGVPLRRQEESDCHLM